MRTSRTIPLNASDEAFDFCFAAPTMSLNGASAHAHCGYNMRRRFPTVSLRGLTAGNYGIFQARTDKNYLPRLARRL